MNMMQNGVPDAYFSGPCGDLWIEFKYITAPKRASTKIKANLSPLQKEWLNNRWTEGRNVGVIVGSNIGHTILIDGWWNGSFTTKYLTNTNQELVAWIETQTHA